MFTKLLPLILAAALGDCFGYCPSSSAQQITVPQDLIKAELIIIAKYEGVKRSKSIKDTKLCKFEECSVLQGLDFPGPISVELVPTALPLQEPGPASSNSQQKTAPGFLHRGSLWILVFPTLTFSKGYFTATGIPYSKATLSEICKQIYPDFDTASLEERIEGHVKEVGDHCKQ